MIPRPPRAWVIYAVSLAAAALPPPVALVAATAAESDPTP